MKTTTIRSIFGVRNHTIYLGVAYTSTVKFNIEKIRRLHAIDIAFFSMGSYWYNGSRRFAAIVFVALVCGAAWSGLVAFVLSSADYLHIDAAIAKKGRSVTVLWT